RRGFALPLLGEHRGHALLLVQNAPAPRLGGMRGERRANVERSDEVAHLFERQTVLLEEVDRLVDRFRPGLIRLAVSRALAIDPRDLLLLCLVYEVEEGRVGSEEPADLLMGE